MEAKIRTYDDLLLEKVRLQSLLNDQRALIRQDVADLRNELKPIKSVLGFAGKLLSKDKRNPVINAGVDLIGDVLLKNFLFARSGFLLKWIAPYIIKNFSANLLAKNQSGILDMLSEKVKQLLSGRRKQ